MQSAGARAAAAILALALGAAGCKPSSLTPFGIDTRDYSSEGGNVNGTWIGKTGSGGDVKFQVGSDKLSSLLVRHIANGCTLSFEVLIIEEPVVASAFTVEIPLEQGRFVATGRFATPSTSTGTYFFEALPAGDCPTAGTGTFTAEKKP